MSWPSHVSKTLSYGMSLTPSNEMGPLPCSSFSRAQKPKPVVCMAEFWGFGGALVD